jgi:hypothetical protein
MSTNLQEPIISAGNNGVESPTANDAEEAARQEAIKQIKRRRSFPLRSADGRPAGSGSS